MNLNKKKIHYKIYIKNTKKLSRTLGKYTGSYQYIELKEDAKPYHVKPFPIPKIHELTLKKEVNRLIKIGASKKIINSQWAAPTFNIPKKKGTVRFLVNQIPSV